MLIFINSSNKVLRVVLDIPEKLNVDFTVLSLYRAFVNVYSFSRISISTQNCNLESSEFVPKATANGE